MEIHLNRQIIFRVVNIEIRHRDNAQPRHRLEQFYGSGGKIAGDSKDGQLNVIAAGRPIQIIEYRPAILQKALHFHQRQPAHGGHGN
jgi:hypothetical protein